MPQAGNVFHGNVLSPQQHDAAFQEQEIQKQGLELNRMRLQDAVEQRKAQIAKAQQQQEQDAYLKDALTRHSVDGKPDFDSVINEAYTKYPDLAMGLEKQVAEHRSSVANARIQDARLEQLNMEADAKLLEQFIVDDETFQIFAPRLSDELKQVFKDGFNPELRAQLLQRVPDELGRLKTVTELIGKNPREALLLDLAGADSPEEWAATWEGYGQLGLKPQEIAALQSIFGKDFTPEGLARVREQLAGAQKPADPLAERRVIVDEKTLGLRERELNQRIRESQSGGASGSSGAGGAKLSATAIEKVAGVDQSIGMLDDIDRLLPKMGGFVGPLDGRAAKMRLATGAGVTPELAEFDAQLTGLKNAVIKATTGAAMSEPEAKRIMGQLPDLSLPEEVFKARLATTRRNLELLKKRTIELSGGSVDAPKAGGGKKLTAEELIKKYGGG
jgi:hypothetical protein